MDATPKTDKLTEREKEALRAWLQHRTAKEIALDLGISHHAVEKRLKMARTKLDVGSSIEAARMLAEAEAQSEEYQQPIAQTPDLPPFPDPRKSWEHPVIVFGGIAVLCSTALAVVLFSQVAGTSVTAQPAPPEESRVAQMTQRTFDGLDEDNSGFLEQPESPYVKMLLLGPEDTVDESGTIARASNARQAPDPDRTNGFYAEADQNGDGKISYAEYHAWAVPGLAELGLDLVEMLKPKD